MIFNQCDDPIDKLAWLSQRNQHIEYDDLEYMLGIGELPSDYPNLDSNNNTDNDDFSFI